MMKENENLLFFGELPPGTINGVAISSLINLKILCKTFKVDQVIVGNTFKHHNEFSFNKIIVFFKAYVKILLKAFNKRYKYFYLVFSLSTIGGLKTLLTIIGFCALNKGKIILHIHRGDFHSVFLKKRINRVITKLVFFLSKKVIVLSESQKNELNTIYNITCEVLPNTIEDEYNFSQRQFQNQHFLFVSNYLLEKGIIDLLVVFSQLCNKYPYLILDTYGAFPNEEIKKIIMEFSSNNIHIHSTLIGQDKLKEFSQADCLIMPSWNEGQPIVLLEAMSVGTPIIASNVGLISEILGADYPYLTNPKDQLSLENVIIEFIESKTVNSQSIKLREKYYNNFSQKKHAEILLQIFK